MRGKSLKNDFEHQSLTERLYEYLRDKILNGEIAPGERLLFDNIGRDLGVSITPWRESIVRLEREGLVNSNPRGGKFARCLNKKEIEDVYELREVLEGLAARKLATSQDAQALKDLANACIIFQDMLRKKDQKGCVQADLLFHQRLVESCQNQKLKEVINCFHLQLFSISQRGPSYNLKAEKYKDEHTEILKLIEEGKIDEAEQTVKEHIRKGKKILIETL